MDFGWEKNGDKESKMRYLFLDDVRTPQDETWEIVRTVEEFSRWIQDNGVPEIVSLDHDLGEQMIYRGQSAEDYEELRGQSKELTGLDACQVLLAFCKDYGDVPQNIFIHSANPVGAERMEQYLTKEVDNLPNAYPYKTVRRVDFKTLDSIEII